MAVTIMKKNDDPIMFIKFPYTEVSTNILKLTVK